MKELLLCSGQLTSLQTLTPVSPSISDSSVVHYVELISLLGVIEDARFKRKEALADLANTVTKK